MFDALGSASRRKLPGYTALSIGVHALVVAFFVIWAGIKANEPKKKEVEVNFIGPGKTPGAPPPPPPPAKKHTSTPKRKPTVAKIEIPKPVLTPVEPPKEDPAPVEEEEDEEGAVEGGVEGGVAGGVVGGVVGGKVGGTGGG